MKEGDRVGVPWLYSACGHCEYCLSAWETICPQAKFGGYTQNGGFAEYVLADPNYVAHIPAGLGPENAAPIICAGITSYKGIKETGAKPGQWIAISGAGGPGHLAIQYAKAMGMLVCAVDVDQGKLAHAKRLCADVTVNAKAGDPAAAVKQATGGGAQGVLITAASLVAGGICHGGHSDESMDKSFDWYWTVVSDRGRNLVLSFSSGNKQFECSA